MALSVQESPLDESSEVLSRWNERWSINRIGWHKTDVHPIVTKFGPSILSVEKNLRVMVPLCGKTVDMKFFAAQENVSRVIGVEGVQKAVEEFINENPELNIKKVPNNDKSGKFDIYEGDKITLFKGNFFDLPSSILSSDTDHKIDVVWDRGSLVAIDPSMRQEYYKSIASVLKPGGSILFATVDRREGTEEAKKMGPPFTVTIQDIETLYHPMISSGGSCEKLMETVEKVGDPDFQRFADSGLLAMYEVTTLLKSSTVGDFHSSEL